MTSSYYWRIQNSATKEYFTGWTGSQLTTPSWSPNLGDAAIIPSARAMKAIMLTLQGFGYKVNPA